MNMLVVAKCLFLREEYSWEKAVEYSGKEMMRVMKESVSHKKNANFDSRYFTMPSSSRCEILEKLYFNE